MKTSMLQKQTPLQTLLARLQTSLAPQWQQLKTSLSGNPRLQLGLLAIASIGIGTGLLSLSDSLRASEKQLDDLLQEKYKLERQVGNNTRLKRLQTQLLITQEEISKGLRTAPTAVIAQADFGDWLNNGLIEAGVKQLKVNQAVYRYTTERDETDSGSDANKSCTGSACSLVELQTQIRFAFDAVGLAKALAFLEGAEKRLTIEQLSINLADQKVEMTVKTLAHITNDLNVEELQQEMRDQANQSEAAPPTADSTTATTAQTKKQVEIKW